MVKRGFLPGKRADEEGYLKWLLVAIILVLVFWLALRRVLNVFQ